MRFEQMLPGSESLTAHEEANRSAERWRDRWRDPGWVGMIHRQRMKMIENELGKLMARYHELRATDPGMYYDGDYNEVIDGLAIWEARDPYDEAQWVVTVT